MMKVFHPSSNLRKYSFVPGSLDLGAGELAKKHEEVRESLISSMRKNNSHAFLSVFKEAIEDGKVFTNHFPISEIKLDEDNSNVFHWICKNNYKEVLEFLLQNKVPFHMLGAKYNKEGYLPLYYALIYQPVPENEKEKLNNQYIIRSLLNLEDYTNSTIGESSDGELIDPIELAFMNGKQEAVNILFKQGSFIGDLPEAEQARLLTLTSTEMKLKDLKGALRA